MHSATITIVVIYRYTGGGVVIVYGTPVRRWSYLYLVLLITTGLADH